MIVASITGTIITELQETKTASGIQRASFVIQSEDEGSLPLRYACVAFGKIGERAVKEIKLGTVLSCYGRFSAGGPEKKICLTISGFEVFEGAKQNGN